MTKKTHNIAKLPKWAQEIINDYDHDLEVVQDELKRLQEANTVLHEREWFTINGPLFKDEHEVRHLWFLDRERPWQACALYPGDILLVGRNQNR